MTRRLFGAVAVLGLGLYLWPALAAPVVRWSDSEADLAWARSGGGIVSPVEETRHTAKPGYLLFLRGAFRLGGERSIVVVQTLLLWGSLVFAAGLFARRRGFGWGAALLVFLLAFLRLRDTASAVMSEALAAALAVALAAVLVPPPKCRYGSWRSARRTRSRSSSAPTSGPSSSRCPFSRCCRGVLAP